MHFCCLQLAPERGKLPAANEKHAPWGEAFKTSSNPVLRKKYVCHIFNVAPKKVRSTLYQLLGLQFAGNASEVDRYDMNVHWVMYATFYFHGNSFSSFVSQYLSVLDIHLTCQSTSRARQKWQMTARPLPWHGTARHSKNKYFACLFCYITIY